MKPLISILFVFLIQCANAQTKKNYNTKIDTAGTVEINGGGKITIQKATQVIINQVGSQIYLLNSETIKDTGGLYTTAYTVGPINHRGPFNINVQIYFDSHFEPLPGNIPFIADANSQLNLDWCKDYNCLSVRGSVNDNSCIIKVKSKAPLIGRISGIVGMLK
jgi:hypothetical protein